MAETELLQCLREVLPGIARPGARMAPEPMIAVLAVPGEASGDHRGARFQLTRCLRERPRAGGHGGVGFPRHGRSPVPQGRGLRRP